MSELQLHPVIPVWLIVLLLIVATGAIWVSYGRCVLSLKHRAGLMGARLATLLVLGFLLLQPELLRVRLEREKPSLPVLIDVSSSMRDSAGDDHTRRAENARSFLKSSILEGLSDRYAVTYFEVGAELTPRGTLRANTLEFRAPRTHLAGAINSLGRKLRGHNVAGVVVLSDGLDQSTAQLIPEARRMPLYMPELEKVPREEEMVVSDTFVADVRHPKMLVVNWKGQVDVDIKRTGEGKLVVPVHLSRRGERIRTGYATFAGRETIKQVTFGIEPFEVGRTTYRIDIEPPADTDLENNRKQFIVDVTDPKNRVLYLEGTPRWEFKFVKRALLKEKNYHISAFVQSGDGIFINFSETSDASSVGELPAFTEENLTGYRVVILGEMAANALTAEHQKALASYVDKGGGLLFLGSRRAYGPTGWGSSETMAKLLPFASAADARVSEGRLPVAPTDLGRTHAILSGMGEEVLFPNVLSVWGPVKAKPAALPVLEITDGTPLLLAGPYGKGKVAALLSDTLWRWQMGAPVAGDEKGLYDRFMSQLVFWLSPQQDVIKPGTSLQVLTASPESEVLQSISVGAILGESTEIQGDIKLNATITMPDRRQVNQELVSARLGKEVGLEQELWGWRMAFTPIEPGEYRIQVREDASGQQAETIILVAEPRLEITGEPLNRAYLQQLADQTGGKYVELEQINSMLDDLPYEPLEKRITTQKPLWNSGWILVLLLGLFIVEWYCRTKLDLV